MPSAPRKELLVKLPRCSGTEQQTIPVRSPLRVLYPPRVTHLPQSHWAPFQFARSAPGDLLLDLILNEQATCCPPLANFAQLSMFRFDGVIKHHVDL